MRPYFKQLINETQQMVLSAKKPIVEIERSWAQFKYLVLSHSPSIYQAIRQLLKHKDASILDDYLSLLTQALTTPLDTNKQLNAMDHIWGYFKRSATPLEKERYLEIRQYFFEEDIPHHRVNHYLYQLAQKYEISYLLDSHYFWQEQEENA